MAPYVEALLDVPVRLRWVSHGEHEPILDLAHERVVDRPQECRACSQVVVDVNQTP